MADTKDSRDKQAQDQDRRQRSRALDEALERGDEPEPTTIPSWLDEALEDHDYPTTAERLMVAHGSHEVETPAGSESLREVFASVDDESFDSADEVRDRLRQLLGGS